MHKDVLEGELRFYSDLELMKKYISSPKIINNEIGIQNNDQNPDIKPPSVVILERLDKFENGQFDMWRYMLHDMLFEENGWPSLNEFEFNIQVTPGWKNANSKTRDRIKKAALLFLQKYNIISDDWLDFNVNNHNRDVLGVYKAFKLLLAENTNIEQSLFQKWLLVILFILIKYEKDSGVKKLFVSKLEDLDSVSIISNFKIIFKTDYDSNLLTEILDYFSKQWNDEFSELLFNELKTRFSEFKNFINAWDLLLKHNYEPAINYLLDSLPKNLNEIANTDLSILCLLARNQELTAWDIIFNLSETMPDSSKKLLAELAIYPKSVIKLPEKSLSKLFKLLENCFPSNEDINNNHNLQNTAMAKLDFFNLGSWNINIRQFKEDVIYALVNRNTELACNELNQLAIDFPDYGGLLDLATKAELKFNETNWLQPSLEDLHNLLADCNTRFIQDNNQLMDAVIKSLMNLQIKLQSSETPAIFDLWDESSIHGNKPKIENRLSDYIIRHLKHELVQNRLILTRETQIRPGGYRKSKNSPDVKREICAQNIDILVKLANTNNDENEGFNDLTLAIEVKSCSNNKLLTAAQNQLLERYMKTNSITHGLYLVCFAHGTYKGDCRHDDIKTLRKTLEDQCKTLSNGKFNVSSFVLDISLYQS